MKAPAKLAAPLGCAVEKLVYGAGKLVSAVAPRICGAAPHVSGAFPLVSGAAPLIEKIRAADRLSGRARVFSLLSGLDRGSAEPARA